MAFHHAKDARLQSAMELAMQDTFASMELPALDVVKGTYGIIEVSFLAHHTAPIHCSMRI